MGDGFKVYINGIALVETKAGLGRRGGDNIRGAWIPPDLGQEFGKTPSEDDKFRYDGKFTTNPKVPGSWTTVALVNSIDPYDPQSKPNPGKAPIRAITFKSDGLTSESRYIGSGDILMDLESNAALRITPKTLGEAEYLFIESGGFGPKNPAGWTSPLMILKRN